MLNRGPFGVTREADGSLAVLWSWPWYWRYPAGIATAVGAVALGAYAADASQPWHGFLIMGCGVLFALACMYELGCLVMAGALVWGAVALIGVIFPSLNFGGNGIAIAAALGAMFAWFVAHTATKLANHLARQVDSLWARVNRVEEERKFATDDLYDRVRELERKADRSRGLGGDFWEP